MQQKHFSYCYKKVLYTMYGLIVVYLKEPWHEIFELCFFLSNNFPWVPDTKVKAFSNMASNSWR
jgi:hypothetical protein